MKTRIVMLAAAMLAVILLTATTTVRPETTTPLSDQQLSQIVGGERMGCASSFVSSAANCMASADAEVRTNCLSDAAESYVWCQVWDWVSSLFSWLF